MLVFSKTLSFQARCSPHLENDVLLIHRWAWNPGSSKNISKSYDRIKQKQFAASLEVKVLTSWDKNPNPMISQAWKTWNILKHVSNQKNGLSGLQWQWPYFQTSSYWKGLLESGSFLGFGFNQRGCSTWMSSATLPVLVYARPGPKKVWLERWSCFSLLRVIL